MLDICPLDKHLSSQGYPHLFRLAFLGDLQSLEIDKPCHLPGYGALGDGEPLCNVGDSSRLALEYVLQNPFLLFFKDRSNIGQGDFVKASFDIAEVSGLIDFPRLGEAGDGEGEEDLPWAAGEVGNDLALCNLQQTFQRENHPLKIPVIDAVDLEVYGAVDLSGKVTDGLNCQFATRILLLFGADEDDSISALNSVFHYQG